MIYLTKIIRQTSKRAVSLMMALLLIVVIPGVNLEANRPLTLGPEVCTSGVYEVGAQHTTTNYDAGVSGYDQVRTVYTENGSLQTRHVAVRADAWNWVELGWIAKPGQAPKYYVGWVFGGGTVQMYEWQNAPPSTWHTFKIVNPTGSQSGWEFWVDNQKIPISLGTTFNVCIPRAQTKALSSCDQNGTTWKELQYYIRSYNSWGYWSQTSPSFDNNPSFYFCPVSNKEFKVNPNAVSC